MGIREKAIKDGRGLMGEGPSEGRNRGSSWHCPAELSLQSTGVGHSQLMSSLFSYKKR